MSAREGFSLVETLVGSAVLVIFMAAIVVMLNSSLQIIGDARVRSMAAVVASERMETIRNARFADVGTVGGIPDGVFASSEIVQAGAMEFAVDTTIVYVDDEFDGQAPLDAFPNDYKQVKLLVSWGGVFESGANPLILTGNVASKGLESNTGGGTIEVSVFDAYGQPVPSASVHLVASTLSPPVDVVVLTDNEGKVELPGSQPCIECYEVDVSKAGMTTDRTYGTDEVANPAKPDLTVIEGDVTQASFAIDVPSTIWLNTVRDASGNYGPFQSVQVRIRGTKEKGRTALDEPVYVYDQQVVSGVGGQLYVENMVWDTYVVEMPFGSSVDLSASWPYTPFSLLPGLTQQFIAVVTSASSETLLVRATDNEGASLTSGAVELVNNSVPFIATQSLGPVDKPDRSQTFFKNLPITLTPYTLTLTSPGMASASTEATVSGDTLEEFILAPL